MILTFTYVYFYSINFSTDSNWFSVIVKNWNCRNVFRLNFGRIENYFYLLIKSLFIIDAVYLFISFQFFYSVYYLILFCLVFDPKLGRFLRRTCQRTCIQNTEDPEGLTPFASTVSPAEYESALTCPGFTDFFFFGFGLFFGMRPELPDFVPSLYQSLIEWMHAIKIAINPSSFSPTSLLHTTQDYLIDLDMKACIHLK